MAKDFLGLSPRAARQLSEMVQAFRRDKGRTRLTHKRRHVSITGGNGTGTKLKYAICLGASSDDTEQSPCNSAIREPEPTTTGSTCDKWVAAVPCDDSCGNGQGTTAIAILLLGRQCTPDLSLSEGDIIAYFEADDGTYCAVTDYSREVIRIELTEDLVFGGEAEAARICWNEALQEYEQVGLHIKVKDWLDRDPTDPEPPTDGWWRAKAGYQGYAVKRCGAPAATDGLEVYDLIWIEEQAMVVLFQLTEPLADGEAAATVTDYALGRDPGTNVTITDANLFKRAPIGAVGIGVWNKVGNTYTAVECQSQAGWVAVELDNDLSGGTSTASVTGYGGSQQDIIAVDDTGWTVTVRDPHGMFPWALSGAKAVGIYDSENDEYILVQCQQRTMHISGSLEADLTSSDTTFTATSYSAMDASPFNQSPTGTLTIYNIFGEEADEGSPYYARWNAAAEQWQLYQVRCPA